MTSIVHDEQGLWTVILSYELADLSFELMLGFFSDSQLNGLRGVVEALLEQGLKLSSLADGQYLWAGHLAQGCLQPPTYLICRLEFIQLIGPFDQKYCNMRIAVWKV